MSQKTLNHHYLNHYYLNNSNLTGGIILKKINIEVLLSNILLEDGNCILTEENKYILLEK